MNFKYGSVLKVTREDKLSDIEKAFELMSQAGMNTVVIWPSCFWWEEKTEGYPFNTGRSILELAEKKGIKIIMELAGQLSAMEYMPDFLMKKEYHPVKLNGERERGQSSFGFLNYFHPEVNEIIVNHFRATAKAYKNFPSLLGYDVFNETMYRSFDGYTIKEFQVWLKEKYGDIGRLNAVWERTYNSFDDIEYENWKWMSIMCEADYTTFRKDAVKRFLVKWVDAVKSVDDTHVIIADNIHSMVIPSCDFERPQDDYGLAECVDEIGMSFYPKQVDGVMENALRNEVFDAYYSASRRNGFYVSEMQTHIQALFNPTTCVRPYELKRWCLESYSSGAKALIYWMWRPFNKGLQTLGRGLVDYKNRTTERYQTAKELSKAFETYGALKPLRANVGILFDSINDDFQRTYTSSYKVDDNIYLSSLYGAYKCAFELNIKADIVTFDEIKNYKVIIISNCLVIDDYRAKILKEYVKGGGVIVIDGKFGIVNDVSLLNSEIPGGEANVLTGVDYLDSDYENLNFTYNGIKVEGFYGRDIVKLFDGTPIGFFDNGDVAVNKIQYGGGEVITFNTYLWYGYYKNSNADFKKVMENIIDEYSLRQVEVDGNVTVKIAKTDGKTLLFVFNYTDKKQTARIKFGGKIFNVSVMGNDSVIVES